MSRPLTVVIGVAVAVMFLGVAYVLLGGDEPRGLAAGPDGRFQLSISAATLGAELPVLEGRTGQTVTLAITSDSAGEIHIHGFAKVVAVAAGEPATLTVEAADAGLFPVEFHGVDGTVREVAVLRVSAR